MLDIHQIRQETPATQHLIHFNNAGASLNPQSVIQKIKDYLDEEAQVGGYELARIRANDALGLDNIHAYNRFSPHYYNTKEEVDKVVEVLSKL